MERLASADLPLHGKDAAREAGREDHPGPLQGRSSLREETIRISKPIINGKQSETFYIVWSDKGRSRRTSTGTDDEEQARRFLTQFKATLASPPEEFTFKDLADAYVKDREQAGKYMPAIIGALRQIRLHFDDYAPSQITQTQVREYIAKRPWYGKDPNTPRPAARSTIDKEIRFLKQVLRYGEREGWGIKSPTLKSTGQNPARERYLSREEYRAIQKHASPHLQLFLKVALGTGLRKSAILQMQWAQVDFDHNMIWADGGNSLKRRASVQMNAALREALEEAKKRAVTPYVVEFRGKPVKDVKRAWQRACQRADIKGVRIHDLRRTAASWMLQAGATFAQVAAVLGDTEEMVRKHYGKFSPSFMRAAVDLIEL